MCGIIGYSGPKQASPIILEGLKKLEYRGYDSAGIAVVDNEIILKKGIGKIAELDSGLDFKQLKGTRGIGHTRWATHGGVTEANAHPHVSNDGKIAVVHNGILENFQEMREFLEGKGFIFKSKTDSEVIPNMIQYHMDRGYGFADAFKRSAKHFEGSYAIAAVHRDSNIMIGARYESPLVVGVGDNEFFLASDIPSFMNHTKKVMFLSDRDMVVIDSGIRVYDIITGRELERKTETIDWDIEKAMKGDFDHFMLKEIHEQAETVNRIVNMNRKEIEDAAGDIRNAKGIMFVACGTSYHAALCASYKFASVAKMHVNVVLASEFPNYVDFVKEETLVIALSQSGETADVLSAVKAAKKKGARIMSIVNAVGSTLTRESDRTVMMRAGPEIGVASTKAYTSELALLTLIIYAVAGKYEEGKNSLKELINFIYYLTSASAREHIKNLAEKLRYAQHIFLIGRDLQYPTALEAALKIKEVSYIHSEGFAGGELKHGTIALIEHGTPCIVFVSEKNEKEIMSNAMEVKARGGYIIGVSPKNNDVFDFWIKVRESGEANSICQIIPMQLLAYQLAVLRGCDPDHPKNLAKAVTVK